MSSEQKNFNVAVFGATGYTGRFVVADLLRRGLHPIAIARDLKALEAANFPQSVDLRQATIDDASSLDRALHGSQVVINCAGPFAATTEAIINAALRAGIHYLDVTAEQQAAQTVFEKFDEPARRAGVLVLPAVAIYGGLSDLMVTALLGQRDSADSIEILVGLDSWHPTSGTRNTLALLTHAGLPLVIKGGNLVPVSPSPARTHWDFGPPLGNQELVEVPFPEAILIPRHVKTAELHNYLNRLGVSDAQDSTTPSPKSIDETGRSSQRFVVEVEVRRGNERLHARFRGRDGYAVSAAMIGEAVERILKGNLPATGARALGEIFDARDFLSVLDPEHSTFEPTA